MSNRAHTLEHGAESDTDLGEVMRQRVLATVQSAYDAERSPEQAGRLAVELIVSQGWERPFLQCFGAGLLVTFWRQQAVRPSQRMLHRVLRSVNDAEVLGTVVDPGPGLIAEAVVILEPEAAVPQQQPWTGAGGRPSALSVLSKDVEALLTTQLYVGRMKHLGDFQRPDVQWKIEDMRSRGRSLLQAMREERLALEFIAGRFRDDQERLRDLIVTGRISDAQLRALIRRRAAA